MKWNKVSQKLPIDFGNDTFMLTLKDYAKDDTLEDYNLINLPNEDFDRYLEVDVRWDGENFYEYIHEYGKLIYPLDKVIAWVALPRIYEGEI